MSPVALPQPGGAGHQGESPTSSIPLAVGRISDCVARRILHPTLCCPAPRSNRPRLLGSALRAYDPEWRSPVPVGQTRRPVPSSHSPPPGGDRAGLRDRGGRGYRAAARKRVLRHRDGSPNFSRAGQASPWPRTGKEAYAYPVRRSHLREAVVVLHSCYCPGVERHEASVTERRASHGHPGPSAGCFPGKSHDVRIAQLPKLRNTAAVEEAARGRAGRCRRHPTACAPRSPTPSSTCGVPSQHDGDHPIAARLGQYPPALDEHGCVAHVARRRAPGGAGVVVLRAERAARLHPGSGRTAAGDSRGAAAGAGWSGCRRVLHARVRRLPAWKPEEPPGLDRGQR